MRHRMRRTRHAMRILTEAATALLFAFLSLTFLLSLPLPVHAASGTAGKKVDVKIPVTYTAENVTENLRCRLEYEENDSQSIDKTLLILKDGEEGTFTLTYTATGTYHCKLHQVKGTAGNIIYDERIFQIDVYVTDDGMGNLMADAVVYTEDSDKLPSVNFTNRMKKAVTTPSEDTPTPSGDDPTPDVPTKTPTATTPTPSAAAPTSAPSVQPPTPTPFGDTPSPTPSDPTPTPETPETTPTGEASVTPPDGRYTEPTVSVTPEVSVVVSTEPFASVTPQEFPSDVSVTPADRTDETNPARTADETPSAGPFAVLMLASAYVILTFVTFRKRRM